MSGRRLREADIGRAVLLLDGWTGKLTWPRFLAVLATEVGHLYTKPGLRKHPRILNAWEMAQARLGDGARHSGARATGDAAVAHLRRKLAARDATIARLEQENRDLLERFLKWSHNAAAKGLESVLDDELVPLVGPKRAGGPKGPGAARRAPR